MPAISARSSAMPRFLADKIKPSERDAMLAATAKTVAKRPAAFPDIIMTSAAKNRGIAELRAEIAGMLGH